MLAQEVGLEVDSAPIRGPLATCGRTHLRLSCSNVCRAIHSFDSANSVRRCAVFLVGPRSRTLTCPNWRLITRNGCSTLARRLALICSSGCRIAPVGVRLFSALRLPGYGVTCQLPPNLLGLRSLAHALIVRDGKDIGFLSAHPCVRLRHVVDVGRHACRRAHLSRARIHADRRFHA